MWRHMGTWMTWLIHMWHASCEGVVFPMKEWCLKQRNMCIQVLWMTLLIHIWHALVKKLCFGWRSHGSYSETCAFKSFVHGPQWHVSNVHSRLAKHVDSSPLNSKNGEFNNLNSRLANHDLNLSPSYRDLNGMSRSCVTCLMWKRCVIYQWVMSHMNESCLIWISDVAYEQVVMY